VQESEMTEEERKQVEQIVAEFLERARLREYRETVLISPWRIIWVNFLAGLARGLGMVIGATVLVYLLVLILGFLMNRLGWFPTLRLLLEQLHDLLLKTELK